MAGHGRRFWLLAASALLLAMFTSPASLFQNEYLRDDRGYSAAAISLFTILTNTPGAIGIVAGGRLADMRGRRIVGAVGVLGGTLATVAMYSSAGAAMWLTSVVGAIVGSAVVPALSVYGPELFPTSLRGPRQRDHHDARRGRARSSAWWPSDGWRRASIGSGRRSRSSRSARC